MSKRTELQVGRTAMGIAIAVILGFWSQSGMAAPTKSECIASSESAQKLRLEGKLRAARAPFQACSDEACPGPVRDDCREQIAAVDAALPAIRFVGRNAAGEVGPLAVSMDGETLIEHDARGAWIVDPGDHVFTLSADRHSSTTRQLVISSGAKDRIEVVTFETVADATGRVQVEGTPPTLRFLGYGLVGAGVAGLALGTVFGLLAKSAYDDARADCPVGPASCTPAGVDGGATAHRRATVSTISFVAGAALAASGAVLIVASLRSSKDGAGVAAGISGTGFRLQGAW